MSITPLKDSCHPCVEFLVRLRLGVTGLRRRHSLLLFRPLTSDKHCNVFRDGWPLHPSSLPTLTRTVHPTSIREPEHSSNESRTHHICSVESGHYSTWDDQVGIRVCEHGLAGRPRSSVPYLLLGDSDSSARSFSP